MPLDTGTFGTPAMTSERLSDAGAGVVRLADLPPGVRAEVVGLEPLDGAPREDEMMLQLMEIGFVEGEPVEVATRGPVGRDPIAVKIGSTIFGLRRYEASHVLVRPTGDAPPPAGERAHGPGNGSDSGPTR